MRRSLGVIILGIAAMGALETCGACSGWLISHAAAHEPAKLHAMEPLTRLGRVLGMGWGDGYHACERTARSPLANLPPHSYAARPNPHPHPAASHRRHWTPASGHAPPLTHSAPSANEGTYPARAMPQSGHPSALHFPVPPAVLEELNSLQNDPQQSPPPQPSATRLPATMVPAGPDQRDPGIVREEISAMLDRLQSEAPALLAPGSDSPTESSPSDVQAPQPLDQPLEETLDEPLEETLEHVDQMLLDDQAAVRHFIREPSADAPAPEPASLRVAADKPHAHRK